LRRELALVVGLSLAFVLGACGRNAEAPFALDGSPRVADDEGIVTAVDRASITIDGERRYAVSDDVVSFSNLTLAVVPLLYTEGQYVQLGVKGKTVRWIGSLARPLTTSPPIVMFDGEVARIDGSDLVFSNGTVLAAGKDVALDGLEGARVHVGLRPDVHQVTEVDR